VTLEERRYRIVSVDRKLPPAEETTPAR